MRWDPLCHNAAIRSSSALIALEILLEWILLIHWGDILAGKTGQPFKSFNCVGHTIFGVSARFNSSRAHGIGIAFIQDRAFR
jgi:hypothetical protein